MSVFLLPKKCIKEIESLCFNFIWPGLSLNSRKIKVVWRDACFPLQEGGLGIKDLHEANRVCCLKLIWRLISLQSSLWVSWIWRYLFRQGSFWTVDENSLLGSWMWRKLLKYRTTARSMHYVEVRSGESTYFWHDSWFLLSSFYDLVGDRGTIAMGMPMDSTLVSVVVCYCSRNHRQGIYNVLGTTIVDTRPTLALEMADSHQWHFTPDKWKPEFFTAATWELIRDRRPFVRWHKVVWIAGRTLKYAFMTWLAIEDKLATDHRANFDSKCLFSGMEEIRNHIFFSCMFSSEIWRSLDGGLLRSSYSEDWLTLLDALSRSNRTFI